MPLLQAIRRNAMFRAREIATIDGRRERTWSEFADTVARLAACLSDMGARAGDRIGILALNSAAYLEAQFAIWWLGATVVPINIRWTVGECCYAVGDSEIRFLFTDRDLYAQALALAQTASPLVLIALDADYPDNAPISALPIAGATPRAAHSNRSDDLAGIFYTGGTTGVAKGVMLSHQALWVNAMSIALASSFSARDRMLHAAPMFHLADGGMSLATTIVGATHVFVRKFVAKDVVEAIETARVTVTLLIPTMIQLLLDDPSYTPLKLASLNKLSFGGAPISDALLTRLARDLPAVALTHSYGQTEMGPTISFLEPRFQYPGSPKKLSVGTAFAAVEVRLVDASGAEAATGVPGEIWARGPGQMSGYLNKPEETAQTIVKGGWIRTGDLATRDEDGFLYICDRIKDMVITGGENVFSGEVENAILTHPAVVQAAVISVPDDAFGEQVHAVVVLKPGTVVTIEELRSHCQRMIASYKCPRSLEIRSEMPMSAVGKVLKRELRAPYWASRERAVN